MQKRVQKTSNLRVCAYRSLLRQSECQKPQPTFTTGAVNFKRHPWRVQKPPRPHTVISTQPWIHSFSKPRQKCTKTWIDTLHKPPQHRRKCVLYLSSIHHSVARPSSSRRIRLSLSCTSEDSFHSIKQWKTQKEWRSKECNNTNAPDIWTIHLSVCISRGADAARWDIAKRAVHNSKDELDDDSSTPLQSCSPFIILAFLWQEWELYSTVVVSRVIFLPCWLLIGGTGCPQSLAAGRETQLPEQIPGDTVCAIWAY